MDYKDPNFWTIISIIAGFVIMIVTLYVQRRHKSLVYTLLTETQLLSVDDEIKGKLQITLDGIAVQDVHLVLLRFWNNGNTPITKSDFDEEPLKISLPNGTKILSVKVVEKKPGTLQPKLILTSPNEFMIKPLLLNKQDHFTIKFLAAEYANNLSVQARIVGVKDVKRISSIIATLKWQYPLIVLGIALLFTITSLWLYPQWLTVGFKGIIVLFAVFLASIIGFISNFKQALSSFSSEK